MRRRSLILVATGLALGACGFATDTTPVGEDASEEAVFYASDVLAMGVDLSYVNQILDHGGSYSDSLGVRSPYAILADHGANAVRLRLWHDPSWVRTGVYEDPDKPLYSGIDDVVLASREAKAVGMDVSLDFHYSDFWADPNRQWAPEAWRDITELSVLADSVYQYTRGVLQRLETEGLLPETVQVGNEINCGMMVDDLPPDFPRLSTCDGEWANQGVVLNAGIRAVREVSPDIGIILHVAQPENVDAWFQGITTTGGVTDFDILGFSYYSKWSDEPLSSITEYVARWRDQFGKEVWLVETAYPWTMENADDYGNLFGSDGLEPGYPATVAGQQAYMRELVQQVLDGGGTGVFYWEPGWISSEMRDSWGTGSAWDNNTLFDHEGRVHDGMRYLTGAYSLPR